MYCGELTEGQSIRTLFFGQCPKFVCPLCRSRGEKGLLKIIALLHMQSSRKVVPVCPQEEDADVLGSLVDVAAGPLQFYEIDDEHVRTLQFAQLKIGLAKVSHLWSADFAHSHFCHIIYIFTDLAVFEIV